MLSLNSSVLQRYPFYIHYREVSVVELKRGGHLTDDGVNTLLESFYYPCNHNHPLIL